MNSELQKVLSLSKFFIPKGNKSCVLLKEPSRLLMHNINYKWLEFIHTKTNQSYPIYLHNTENKQTNSLQYGLIKSPVSNIPQEMEIDCQSQQFKNKSKLELHLFFPLQDVMQQFIKWQRYRKFWWSSITTTPSLFQISDMKSEGHIMNVNITANFSWGQHIVENITLHSNEKDSENLPSLVCNTGLENALLTLLLDGQTNSTKEGYLRLHNKLAPYKISFALDAQDSKETDSLKDLAKLLYYKLQQNKISTWLPDFILPLASQVKENLELGVTYTAIFDKTTLNNGIFHLLYSSTMLKEQVHVADFENYARSLCRR